MTRYNYIEVVGLFEKNNGRTCKAHPEGCGLHVEKNAVIFLKPLVIINQEDKNEYAIGAYLMNAGVESCLIGFIAREFHCFRGMYEFKLVQILELLSESKNTDHH